MSRPARIKTFADVDTSSDFEMEEDPASKSAVSLTFRTEQTDRKSAAAQSSQKAGRPVTESEGSIMFDSDSEDDDVRPPASAAAAPAQQAAQAAAPAKSASPLAGLMFSRPTKPSTTVPAPVTTEAPPPPQRQQTQPPPVVEAAPPVEQAKPQSPPPAAPAAVQTVRSTQAATPPPTPPAPAVPAQEASPQPRPPPASSAAPVVASTRPVSAGVVPRRTVAAPPKHAVESSEEDDEHDSFAEAVLPRTGASTHARDPASDMRYQVRIPPARSSVPARPSVPEIPDEVNELLVRAQLRLEEKKRSSDIVGGSTPRQRMPSPRVAGQSSVNTPYRGGGSLSRGGGGVAVQGGALTIASPRTSSSLHDDAKMRRLTQENARLVEEVNYLNRETQKLRSASGTADTAEAMRLQLTVDMLRKEIQSRELERQQEREELLSKVDASEEQIRQLVDQTESYASSAEQYSALYQEKLRELEEAKVRFQAVLEQVQTVEQRQRVLEQQHKDRLEAERDRAERAVTNLHDVKQQRDHIQQLNEQLQAEVQRAAEEKRQLKSALEKATADTRQTKEDADRRVEGLREELDRLGQTVADKEKRHVAQLREEQRQQATLQQRLEQAQAEHQDEVDRLRRSADAAREDAKRMLREERDRRLRVEDELRRAGAAASVLPSSRDATSDAYTATMAAELERRLKECKAELDQERRVRVEVEAQRMQYFDELDQVQQALQYYQQEVTSLSERLAQSEQMRDASDSQRALLQSALDDLIGHDDQLAQRVADLEAALDATGSSSRGRGDGGARDGAHREQAAYDAEQLSVENDRLSAECERLTDERDQLLEDNGRIAEELLKWKDEMRRFASSYTRTPASAAAKRS